MKVSLVKELCRVFNSSEGMMLLAMYHRQVTVDGHIVRPEHDLHWTRKQLAGRVAVSPGRCARLFGGARRSAHNATQVQA